MVDGRRHRRHRARCGATFFNQPWRERQLRPGIEHRCCSARLEIVHGAPPDDQPGRRPRRRQDRSIVAVYPQSEKAGCTRPGTREAGWPRCCVARARGIADPVPPRSCAPARTSSTARAPFHDIHQPESMARRASRPAAGWCSTSCSGCSWRWCSASGSSSGRLPGIGHDARRRDWSGAGSTSGCPFPLTGAQRRVIAEIEADLGRPHPMHRLLQGDVGSGKTVVAVSALLVAVQGGHQGALMAPTEVLAEQHYLGRARPARRASPCPTTPTACSGARRPLLRVELLTNRTTGGRAAPHPGRAGRRLGRPRHRHPRAHPGGQSTSDRSAWSSSTSSTASASSSGPRCATQERGRARCPTCW